MKHKTAATAPAAPLWRRQTAVTAPASTSFARFAFAQLLHKRLAVAGAVVLCLLILTAICAPVVAPYAYDKQDWRFPLAPPMRLRFDGSRPYVYEYKLIQQQHQRTYEEVRTTKYYLEFWTPEHKLFGLQGNPRQARLYLLGTDHVGRDILSRIIYGARISLRIGLISVGIAGGCGLLLGLISGYHGGWVDGLIMRVIDVMLAFPGILLALAIISLLGANLTNVMIAVGVSAIPTYTRLVRAAVLSAKENLYVSAAQAIGCSTRITLCRHILPNIIAPVIILATLGVAGAILSAAALSFIGLGAQPPTPEWGAILSDGREYLRYAWWVATFPGLAIVLTVLAINALGDGLRDALDPRIRYVGRAIE
jgi:peptide/nickel transport system permease protein